MLESRSAYGYYGFSGGTTGERRPAQDYLYKVFEAEAYRLEELLDTDYAIEHADEWDDFERRVKDAYRDDEITAREYNTLFSIAFYDWFDFV